MRRSPSRHLALTTWRWNLAHAITLGLFVCSCGGADEPAGTAKDAGVGGDSSDATVERDDSAADSGGDADGGTGECVPKSCAQLGANCGSAPDGCGGKVECGGCAPGQQCGGGGVNVCGTDACSPKSCMQVGASCGYASDGCSEAIDCGGCPPPATCGGGGELNECGCLPKSCAQLSANCGVVPDGCGDALDCGDCPQGQFCGGDGPNQCGSNACAPKTCAQLNASCGVLSDGCGEVLDCGTCAAPEECGGDGVANQCGCSAKTCEQLGANCGIVEDGCGTKDCGDCAAPDTCGGGGEESRCGCTCTLPHASTDCAAGVCSVQQCDAGWGDCDGVASNGCETDVNSAVAHCGACGNSCPTPANGTATCVNATCTFGCNWGWGDCNGSGSDGCETNTNSDASHCGGCGAACDTGNADCDAPDVCDGAGHCAPRYKSSSTVCRPAVDPACDVPESCTGSSSTCPADAFGASGLACGSQSSSGCNAPDTCDGAGHCVDRVKLQGVVCRTGSLPCDPPEACNGTSSTCPPDSVASSGTACGSSSNSGCNAPDSCDGSGSCIARFKSSSTICRAAGSSATCDPAEYCTGTSTTCPSDKFASSGTSCASGGVCDGYGDCCDSSYGDPCVYFTTESAWACKQFEPYWCTLPDQSLYSVTSCQEDTSLCGPLPDQKCFVQCLHAWDGVYSCNGVCQ